MKWNKKIVIRKEKVGKVYKNKSNNKLMSIGSIFKKIGSTVSKQAKKAQINSKRKKDIEITKEKYLSHLSSRELVQIYKAYLSEE